MPPERSSSISGQKLTVLRWDDMLWRMGTQLSSLIGLGNLAAADAY